MKLDKGFADRIERGIAPPMAAAITIPVVDDEGKDTGVVVYVAASPFQALPRGAAQLAVEYVARRLELKS